MADRQPRRRAQASTDRGGEVVRITTAAESPRTDLLARQRRYVISMAIRTVCVVGAVVAGPGVLRWLLIAGAVFLPYVAVIFANAANRRGDGFRLPEDVNRFPELRGPRP